VDVATIVVAEGPVDAGVLVEVLLSRRVEGSFGSGGWCDVSREVPRHGSHVEVVLCPDVLVVRVPRSRVLHVEERRVVGVDVVEAPRERGPYWGDVVPGIVVVGGNYRRFFLKEGG